MIFVLYLHTTFNSVLGEISAFNYNAHAFCEIYILLFIERFFH